MESEEEKPVKEPRGLHRYNQNKKWTAREERELLAARARGYTWSQVGAWLHRTKMAVYTRAKYMKRRKIEEAWTEEERKEYRAEYNRKRKEKSRIYRENSKRKRGENGSK